MPLDKIKLLYLVSAPYSGSTLVSLLLGSHPDIATVGELSGPDPRIPSQEYPCSCGVTLVNCPFWREITDRMAQKGITYSILKQNKQWRVSNRVLHHLLTRPFKFPIAQSIQKYFLIKVPPFKNRISTYLLQNVCLIKEVKEYYCAQAFLDTSKDLDRVQLLKLSPELDVYIVHLVRDGKGQTCSKLKRGFSMKNAAHSLVNFDRRALNLQTLGVRNRYISIRYENVCQNPVQELSKVAKFAGLGRSFLEKDFSCHDIHVLGNMMCLNFTGKVDEDQEWSNALSESDLKVFMRIAGKRNKIFGYHE